VSNFHFTNAATYFRNKLPQSKEMPSVKAALNLLKSQGTNLNKPSDKA